MISHDIELQFGALPESTKYRFVWNGPEWWNWFGSFCRRPSATAIYKRLREYDSFVSFHCSRPLEVPSLYKNGLRLGDVSYLNEQARKIFLSGRFPEITPPILEKAIAEALTCHDQMLFAVADEREISGHYLIYGSEHICGIAASMVREVGFDCRQILKMFGTPTVLRIEIPSTLISDCQLRSLAKYLVEAYWSERRRTAPPRIDWSWILKKPIPAGNVIDHVHPDVIPDPLMQYTPYSYRDNFPCFY